MVTVLYYKEKDTPEAQHGPWRSRATSSLRNSSGHRRHPVPSPPVSLAQEERLLGMWGYLSAFLPHQLKEDPVQGSVLSECKTQPGVGTQIRRQWLGEYGEEEPRAHPISHVSPRAATSDCPVPLDKAQREGACSVQVTRLCLKEKWSPPRRLLHSYIVASLGSLPSLS